MSRLTSVGLALAMFAGLPLISAPACAQTLHRQNINQWLPYMPMSGGVHYDTNRDGVADLIYYDINRDSSVEAMRIDANYDGWVETIALDSDRNGIFEQLFIDRDRNGSLETFRWFSNGTPEQSSRALLDEFMRNTTGYSYQQLENNPRLQAQIIGQALIQAHSIEMARVWICTPRYYRNGQGYC
jgi:hypothetical protein